VAVGRWHAVFLPLLFGWAWQLAAALPVGPVVAPGFSRGSIVILVAGREPDGAVIIEPCDRVVFVNADDRGSDIDHIFEKQSLATHSAGFGTAHGCG
jgi:hypothetical protein